MEAQDDGFIDLNLPLDEYGAIDFEAPQYGQFVIILFFMILKHPNRTTG